MKHHYETILAVALCALSFSAQAEVVYEPMIVASGFNRDVIAEDSVITTSCATSPIYSGGVKSCFATQSVIAAKNRNASKSYIKTKEDYDITVESGWPDDYRETIRCILDAKDSALYRNVIFQLAPYDQNNALTLRPDNGIGGEHTLKFKKVGCYNKMFFMTASLKDGTPQGDRKVSAIVRYTDGTTTKDTFCLATGLGGQDGHKIRMTNIYEESPSYFIKNTSYYTPPNGRACVSIFEIDLDSTKLVDRVDFKNEVAKSAAIIFAVTGRTADMEIPDEEEAVTSAITENSFTISWDEVGEAETYRVDVATDEAFQHMVGDYNNLEVSKNDTIVYGLDGDTDYYWRVRSVNAAGGQSASSAPRRARTAGINPPQTRETDEDIEEQLAPYVGYRATLAEIDIHRTFYRDGYFNTICLPFALSQEYIDTCAYFTNSRIFAFTSAAQNGDQLDLVIDPVTSIDAGIPYLIKWADYGDVIPSPLKFYNVNITTNKGDSVGDPDGIRFVGHIGMQQIELNKDYNLFVGGNDMLYWPDNTNSKMKGFRAYFALPHELPSGAPIHRGMAARLVEQNNAPTGMEEQQTESYSQKMLRDGQVIIIRNGKTYNALGIQMK